MSGRRARSRWAVHAVAALVASALVPACVTSTDPVEADVDESQEALAQGSCGPRDKPWMIVPDSLNVGVFCSVASGGATIVSAGKSADFGQGCTHHDKCYWTLGSDRGACDASLRGDARDACRRAYKTVVDTAARECCYAFADAYGAAVRSGGKGPYDDGQKDAQRAADGYQHETGYVVDATLIDIIAETCLTHVSGSECQSDVAAGTLVTEQRRIEGLYFDYLDASPTEGEMKELLALYWNGGKDLEPARALVVQRHGLTIVDRQTRKVLGEAPTVADRDMLVGVLRSYGIASMKEQILIRFAKPIVAKLYLQVNGTPITFAWSLYYERLLVQKKDVAYVRQEMVNQRKP